MNSCASRRESVCRCWLRFRRRRRWLFPSRRKRGCGWLVLRGRTGLWSTAAWTTLKTDPQSVGVFGGAFDLLPKQHARKRERHAIAAVHVESRHNEASRRRFGFLTHTRFLPLTRTRS